MKRTVWNATKVALLLLLMTFAGSMSAEEAQAGDENSFTPETLMKIWRISSPVLSPDGSHFLYTRTMPNLAENSSRTEIVIAPFGKPGEGRVLPIKGHSPIFMDDNSVAYVSTSGDRAQVAVINIDGSNPKTLSSFDFDVTGFLFSPDRSKVIISRMVDTPLTARLENPDLDKASGRIYDDLMYKHWDHWTLEYPQSYIAEVAADLTIAAEVTNVLPEGETYELPIEPFGGIDQLAWHPNSNLIAYSCKKLKGVEYARSTNTDIYLLDLDKGTTTNVTEGMMGYDDTPKFSPDGKSLAWVSMQRDGYEADLKRLFVMDMATGQKSFVSANYELWVEDYAWLDDSQNIRFATYDQGLGNLFEINIKNLKANKITNYEMADVVGFSGSGKNFVFALQSLSHPTDIYTYQAPKRKRGEAVVAKMTLENDQLLATLPNIEVQKRWITTTDGKQMLTWVVLPPNFDESKKYPAILYCQGGPQSTVSQFWSYRWNLRTFASHGYIIVAPNRRGVPGFGKEWNEQISGDWGGQNMKDLLMAIDTVAEEPYVDENRLGCTGASYGGYTTYWMAGHHEGRFKAFAAHAGIFNFEAQYLETEEKFFADWDMGGAYWEDNAATRHTYANSPHKFVDRWDTPILITHGDRDYRILSSQGFMAFDAAKLRGIPARILYFPDESHWILQPQNGVLFYRTWFDWMDRYLMK
ncbi:MAG: S9 family peptidase [Porphyromonas sp.]|nr:S9 family peptidase [Porphyromonas sp.]